MIRNLITEFQRYFDYTDHNDTSFNKLKHIAAHITQAELYLELANEGESLRECIRAMEKLKNMKEHVNNYGNLTKYAFLSVASLFFERILFLLSNLSEKYDQKKTQFFIYLNLLDLGPVYDKKIRSKILQKLLDYLNKTGLDIMKIKNVDFFQENTFVNTKLVRHKVRAMLNMTKNFHKNILLLFDLDYPFMKDKTFQNIIINNIEKENHFYHIALFDYHLYINKNIDSSKLNKYNSQLEEEYVKNINQESREEINLEDDDKEYNKYKTVFKFVDEYQKVENVFTKNRNRLDNAIKHSLQFYQFKEYPKNNNFLIVFTTIDSGFSFEQENVKSVTSSLYETQYTLILCILYKDKIFTDQKYKTKFECYKKFVEDDVINGHIFLVNSFIIMKYILNCVTPQKFKEFDTITMRTILESVDIAYNSNKNHEEKNNSNINEN